MAAGQELAQHNKNLASVGFPCTRDDVRILAYDYAARDKIQGFSEKKGKSWLLLVSEFPTTISRVSDFCLSSPASSC